MNKLTSLLNLAAVELDVKNNLLKETVLKRKNSGSISKKKEQYIQWDKVA